MEWDVHESREAFELKKGRLIAAIEVRSIITVVLMNEDVDLRRMRG